MAAGFNPRLGFDITIFVVTINSSYICRSNNCAARGARQEHRPAPSSPGLEGGGKSPQNSPNLPRSTPLHRPIPCPIGRCLSVVSSRTWSQEGRTLPLLLTKTLLLLNVPPTPKYPPQAPHQVGSSGGAQLGTLGPPRGGTAAPWEGEGRHPQPPSILFLFVLT